MAGRPTTKANFRLSDEHRTKIANSQILNRLIGHIEGSVDMSPTQVTAGVALLRKVLPDLSQATITGDDENPLRLVTRIELVAPDATDS